MLALNFQTLEQENEKNPVKGFPPAPIGWYLSEKYDGYRHYGMVKILGQEIIIYIMFLTISRWLPPGIALDGELFG